MLEDLDVMLEELEVLLEELGPLVVTIFVSRDIYVLSIYVLVLYS